MSRYFSIIEEEVLETCPECGEPTREKIIHDGADHDYKTDTRCACWLADHRREELEALAEEKAEHAKKVFFENRANCFSDHRTGGSSFANDRRPNSNPARVSRSFVNRFRSERLNGRGLLFYGSPGTGKSFYAGCICNALTKQGFRCLFTNTAKIINDVERDFKGKQDRLEEYGKYDLVVLDDFGVERQTEYKQELVTMIIDCLYRHKVPTIITTNKDFARMISDHVNLYNMRIYSRLSEMCVPLKFTGRDMRKDLSEWEKITG